MAVRYSQNRSGVEMTAPSVRSCFSKNTVPATKKNPMIADVTQQDVGLGSRAQAVRHRQQHRQPDEPGEDGGVQEPLPHLERHLEPQRADQPAS